MSCRKVSWPSRRDARRFLRRNSWKGRVYRCDDCQGWHITMSYDADMTRWAREQKA